MSESGTSSPLDALASLFEEYKYGLGKNLSIVRSSSAIVSVTASSLLVWILFRSRDGIKTTYHRLLLGLSISDMLLSLSWATFGAVVPSEMSYAVWNARGSLATCDAFAFLHTLGSFSGLLYMCSLNLYYVAKVKYNKTDYHIETKLERWLHGVPILYGLILSSILLAKQRVNADRSGQCTATNAYDPPHCSGYEDGDTPEGFEIPCGRGRSAVLLTYFSGLTTLIIAPITIAASLWTIYRSVSKAERRMAQYGAGSLRPNHSQPTSNDAATADVEGGNSGGRGASSILSVFKRQFGGRASRESSNNQDSSQSRAVLHRAAAYSVAYFLTWIWIILYGFLNAAGAWPSAPSPKWALGYFFVMNFFTPLQGLWTLLIYMQPNVIKRKRSSDGNMSWFRAFADALWSAVTGGNNSARRGRRQSGRGAPRTAAATGHRGSNPVPSPEGGNTSATIGSTVGSADRRSSGTNQTLAPGAEDREPGTGPAPVSSGTSTTSAPGAEGTGAAARAVPRGNKLGRPEYEEEKKEIEPCEDEEKKCEFKPHEEDDGGGFSTRETLSSNGGFESFCENVFGSSDPQGAGTVADGEFSSFVAHIYGHNDPQGGLAPEESVGLEVEGAEEENTQIEECQPKMEVV